MRFVNGIEKMVRFIIFFVPSILLAQYDDRVQYYGIPKSVVLFKGGCEPQTTCRTNLQGQDKDFSLRWSRYREGSRYFMAMEINGQKFNVSTRLELIRSKPFPLELYIFSSVLKLYGSLSAGGSGGLYVHYFSRGNDGNFHYLGRFPFLAYEKDSGHFVGGENFAPGEHITSYYKLEENSLVLKRTENSLDEQ